MRQANNLQEFITELLKLRIDNQIGISEKEKEARKEFIEGTKELFINNDEKKASIHFARLAELITSK